MRGNDARIHTKIEAIIIDIEINIRLLNWGNFPIKNDTVRTLIIKILAYSAIKIKANAALLYSVLNPETNSDSPSAKSKGARFVSAKLVINHRINIGNNISITLEYIFMFIKFIFIKWWVIRQDNKISAIDTSYEIVWAILRSDPKRAYLEFEHHPAIKVEYTLRLDTHKKYNTPVVSIIEGYEWG